MSPADTGPEDPDSDPAPPLSALSPGRSRAAVTRLLSRAFEGPVVVESCEQLAPWAVLRARLADPGPGRPSTVIVKWARDNAAGRRTEPDRIRTEFAALCFLARDLRLSLASRPLALDPAGPMIALEDLGPRHSLETVLRERGAGDATIPHLIAFAEALGRLNAATAGEAARFRERMREAGGVERGSEGEAPSERTVRAAVAFAASMGAGVTGAAEADLAAALEELADPGPFLALTNGDSGMNNFLLGDTGGRLIDFEAAGFRHALTSASNLHVPGPPWITVADPVALGLEDAYRTALGSTVPQALDDRRFGFGMAAASLAHALQRLGRLPVLLRRAPGDASHRQMISTLEAAARAAETHRALPGLAGWARRVADMLRSRWRHADADFTACPAFTPRDRHLGPAPRDRPHSDGLPAVLYVVA
ncbi:hypothetical protein QFZ82_000807 [Streptomyces sp. V4I23]|uniref:hypothetical protein n=1 Tax=Streptomyces sp. V4I23 TaxID=3042282 RepID=UPI00277DBED3|nr:hypothetical protein [Streptomyces sp. V4I23]MDQ1006322.1 hypothetical protein [Streptomyces sp. V4I23]